MNTEQRETRHRIRFQDSRRLSFIPDNSVNLIVTSPPYPMIELWDDVFIRLNPSVGPALADGKGLTAFERMHCELDVVWLECWRVLKLGGIICINIGDAVRTVGDKFQLYPNHARIISAMQKIGFDQLPDILWRKQTNAPNKFMGSGMLPTGAYVTYEHEYILIFRKGDKRKFSTPEEKADRRASAYFWEERNVWFSDIWLDIKGTRQHLKNDSSRVRSAAFPFELAYRLICMYSVYNDTVFDPFLGSGTTAAAAIAGCRHSIGVEIDDGFTDTIKNTIRHSAQVGENRILQRMKGHKEFVDGKKQQSGYVFKHYHSAYRFEVMTSQEKELTLFFPLRISEQDTGEFIVTYGNSGSAKDTLFY